MGKLLLLIAGVVSLVTLGCDVSSPPSDDPYADDNPNDDWWDSALVDAAVDPIAAAHASQGGSALTDPRPKGHPRTIDLDCD